MADAGAAGSPGSVTSRAVGVADLRRTLLRDVTGWWLLTRLAAVLIGLSAPVLTARGPGYPSASAAWQHWDVQHFADIARYGYFGTGGSTSDNTAFFPGLPLVMRAGLVVGLPPVVTGMIVAALASWVAAVALAVLTADTTHGDDARRRRVAGLTALVWLAAPMAVFGVVAYTEPLFCACAFTAWVAARRGRWAYAGILAALATGVRISGLFLAVALVVEFCCSRQRRLRGLPWLALPALPLVAYGAYLHAHTGSWLAWVHAQQSGWQRGWTAPWTSLLHTVQAGFTHEFSSDQYGWSWMFRIELVAVLVAIGLIVVLLAKARYAEAVFVVLNTAAFLSSYWVYSFARSLLTWWPLWLLLGPFLARRTWAARTWFALVVPLATVWAFAFFSGQWAG